MSNRNGNEPVSELTWDHAGPLLSGVSFSGLLVAMAEIGKVRLGLLANSQSKPILIEDLLRNVVEGSGREVWRITMERVS